MPNSCLLTHRGRPSSPYTIFNTITTTTISAISGGTSSYLWLSPSSSFGCTSRGASVWCSTRGNDSTCPSVLLSVYSTALSSTQPPHIVDHEVGYSRVPPSARTTRHNIGPAFNSGVWIWYDPCNFRASRAEILCNSSVVGACCIHVRLSSGARKISCSSPEETAPGHCVS
jgi:hypothetical protein